LSNPEPTVDRVEAPPGVDLPPLQMQVATDNLGRPIVVLIVTTSFGSQAYPMPAEFAQKIGTQLHEAGGTAASGVVRAGPASSLIIPGR
jgi:hypothetical protein